MTDTLDYIFKQPCQNFRGRWLQKQWYNHNTCKLFYKIKPWPQRRSHILTSSLKPTFSLKTPAKVCFAIASLTKTYLNNDNCPWLSLQHSSPSRAALVLQDQRLWALPPSVWARAALEPLLLGDGHCTASVDASPWDCLTPQILFLHLIHLPHMSHCIFFLPVYNGTVGISME